MKEIASSIGISEMTVFRHFSSKKGILEALIQKCSLVPSFTKIQSEFTWELEPDLLLISRMYYEIMYKNQSIMLILMQEKVMFPDKIWEGLPPYYLKDFLTNYFKAMQDKGKIVTQSIDAITLAFISLNFGYLYSKVTLNKDFINVSDKTYIDVCIKLFAKSLKP